MILVSLSLLNFGLYGGSHSFDLTPDPDAGKPLILIRGHNGAGKTTFLEAVRLALYGKRALGPRISQSDYEEHLLRRIHYTAPDRHAHVELTFSSRHTGDNDIYCVTRAWAARGTSVVETLEFTRNGTLVTDIPNEDWEHYLEDIIPAGVSQLFFFDGEKIQGIADDTANDGLIEAIRSLLGLDLIDQLRGDLALFKARADDLTSDIDLEAVTRDLKTAQKQLVLADEKAASLNTQRNQFARKSERAQQVFQQEGGTVAVSKDSLNAELKTAENDFKSLESALRNLVNGSAPFALAPKLVGRFANELLASKDMLSLSAVKSFLREFEDASEVEETSCSLWTQQHFRALMDFAEEMKTTSATIQLSAEPDWIVEQLSSIPDERRKAARIGTELASVLHRRALLRDQIKNYQPGVAAEAFENLRAAEFAMGGVETELRQIRMEVDRLRVLVSRLKVERQKAIDAQFDSVNAAHKMDMATRTQAALAQYEQRILDQRLSSLSTHFVEAFNGLVQRKDLIDAVKIDRETFAIQLIDHHGKVIDADSLSAGERQLFAISMLWGLGKTSGRELPMIIDTPLSRLDSVHRRSLVGEYLPKASSQVVMLCTDTELTSDLADLVAPYVSKSYEIGVEGTGQQTSISKQIESQRSEDLVDAHH